MWFDPAVTMQMQGVATDSRTAVRSLAQALTVYFSILIHSDWTLRGSSGATMMTRLS